MTRGTDLEMTEVDVPDKGRADEYIMRHIGIKPVMEIAQHVGMKPEEVLRRKTELLTEIDVLDVQEKRVKIMATLDNTAQEMLETSRNTIDEFKAGQVNAAIGAMKLILVQLNQLEAKNSGAVNELNQKRVAELVSLVREVIDLSVVELATKYGLDEDELYEVFNRRMNEAAQKRDLS